MVGNMIKMQIPNAPDIWVHYLQFWKAINKSPMCKIVQSQYTFGRDGLKWAKELRNDSVIAYRFLADSECR